MTLPNLNIDLMGLDEKIKLRKEIQKQISKDRLNKNLRITTFIPALKINDFNHAKEWAFNKGFFAKNTNWAFTKFAVLNTIDLILGEIKTEMELQQQNDLIENNQDVPIQATNQHVKAYQESNTNEPI